MDLDRAKAVLLLCLLVFSCDYCLHNQARDVGVVITDRADLMVDFIDILLVPTDSYVEMYQEISQLSTKVDVWIFVWKKSMPRERYLDPLSINFACHLSLSLSLSVSTGGGGNETVKLQHQSS
jgi:hypothetical protein